MFRLRTKQVQISWRITCDRFVLWIGILNIFTAQKYCVWKHFNKQNIKPNSILLYVALQLKYIIFINYSFIKYLNFERSILNLDIIALYWIIDYVKMITIIITIGTNLLLLKHYNKELVGWMFGKRLKNSIIIYLFIYTFKQNIDIYLNNK